MTDDVLPVEQVTTAEPWLLPEFKAKHIVSGADEPGQLSGFSQRPSAASKSQASPLRLSRAMTAGQLEQLTAEAREAGFKEGRADGYEKGYAEGESRARETVEQHAQAVLADQQLSLTQLIESIVQPLGHQREDLQKVLSQLVAKISERVCYRELLSDNSSIQKVVNEAIDALPIGESDIKIYLNPKDLAVFESIPGFVQDSWPLRADKQLTLGDCRIESANSLVDFTRSSRMTSILDATFALNEHE